MKNDYGSLATPDYGSVLGREHFIDYNIQPIWRIIPRIAGLAYTVQLAAGDNLMLHKAIYEAPEGSILVVDAVDTSCAVAGGNVCSVAQARGIQGFVIDGVIRDLIEIREARFPVYARGVFPVPGKKNCYTEPAQPITCGGVRVNTGDVVIADEEGIAILPQNEASLIFDRAKQKADAEQLMTLDQWRENHMSRVEQAIIKSRS